MSLDVTSGKTAKAMSPKPEDLHKIMDVLNGD